MFELFDQFLYISILIIGAYLGLYRFSRGYAGLLLIICSVLANSLFFSIVMDPFIFVALPITAVMMLNDWVEDFRTGRTSHKHKLGAGLAIFLIIYTFIVISDLSHFKIMDSFRLFQIGSTLGILTGIYLIVYPVKELFEDRQVNIQEIKRAETSQMLENQKQQLLADGEELDLDDEESLLLDDSQSVENGDKPTGQSPFPDFMPLTGNMLYLAIGVVIIVLFAFVGIMNKMNTTVLDMQDYVFVTYDHNAVTTTPSYYASYEHLDKNNFYNELIEQGSEYGLDEKQISQYTPVYDSDSAKMWKGLNPKVALDKDTVSEGDIVTVNINYDQNYAKKHHIVLKNTNFTSEITGMQTAADKITSSDISKSRDNIINLITEANPKLGLEKATNVTFGTIEDNGLKLIVTFEGTFDGGLLRKDKTSISFQANPYFQNDSLQIDDNFKQIDPTDLEIKQI